MGYIIRYRGGQMASEGEGKGEGEGRGEEREDGQRGGKGEVNQGRSGECLFAKGSGQARKGRGMRNGLQPRALSRIKHTWEAKKTRGRIEQRRVH